MYGAVAVALVVAALVLECVAAVTGSKVAGVACFGCAVLAAWLLVRFLVFGPSVL